MSGRWRYGVHKEQAQIMAGDREDEGGSPDRIGVICAALRSAIIERALEPGAKLPEDALGECFGVSRTIARQALSHLASQGLVELRRNRIALVATPSWQDARITFDIRTELERLVVRQLVGKLGKPQIAALRAHVAAEDAARGGPDAVSIRLATEFHILLAEMTGSPIMIRYVSEIAYRCCLTLAQFSRPHSSECGINEHRALVDALESGDADMVERLMAQHIHAVAERALVTQGPRPGLDFMDIMAPYAEVAASNLQGRPRSRTGSRST